MQDIAVIVNIILCILSFALAAISVITVIVTLKQNNRMIEESTRPYVTARIEHIGNIFYLCIKNYGQSAAMIKKIKINDNVRKVLFKQFRDVFSDLEDSTMPPGYSYMTAISQDEVSGEENILEMDISYESTAKKYDEHIRINLDAHKQALVGRTNVKPGEELKVIARVLQDIECTLEK